MILYVRVKNKNKTDATNEADKYTVSNLGDNNVSSNNASTPRRTNNETPTESRRSMIKTNSPLIYVFLTDERNAMSG